MKNFKKTVLDTIRTSNKLCGKLMQIFDVRQRTIELWSDKNDIKLYHPSAIMIIADHLDVTNDDLFETN